MEYLPELAESPAQAIQEDIYKRRTELVERFSGFEVHVSVPPQTVINERVGMHDMVAIDISGGAGGSFKGLSAEAGMLMLPEGTRKVAVPSAGGFLKGAIDAGERHGITVVGYTPHDINPVKEAAAVAKGIQLDKDHRDVKEATAHARADAADDAQMDLLHPYDNPNSIAGLTFLADQVVETLRGLEASGLDITARPVKLLVQRGGGSLITAMALALHQAKAAGLVNQNVSLVEVRPELVDGDLDPLYDGLKVDEPGSIASTILEDSAYVTDHCSVGRAAVADAARWMAAKSTIDYEANALAGLGAAEELRRSAQEPTVFVTLLTGRNADLAQRLQLLQTPGLEQQVSERSVVDLSSMRALGGYTLRRSMLLTTARQLEKDPYQAPNKVVKKYYRQLGSLGIHLTRAGQYQR